MKAVILYGSPRKNGSTSRLVSAFCKGLPEGTDVKLFSAYELPVKPCRSCGLCSERYDCPYDDMDAILHSILECELLVIASPVYYLSFPAPLKAIIDRMQQCFAAYRQGRSPFSSWKRHAVVLLSAGSPSERGDFIRQQLRWVLPPLNATLSGMVVCANTDAEGITPDAIEEAMELGESFR